MVNYKLTTNSIAELDDIYYYSIEHFGKEQAQKYIKGLHHSFSLLGENPRLGRRCDLLDDDIIYRHEYERHVIYYDVTELGVLVLHIIGAAQDPVKCFK